MAIVWCLTLFLPAAALEVALGSAGIPVPVVVLVGFHHLLTQGWRRSFIPLALAATLVDLQFCRPLLPTLFAVPPLLAFAGHWRRHGELTHWGTLTFSGFAIGLAWSLIVNASVFCSSPWASSPAILAKSLVWAAVSGAVLVPAISPVLDEIERCAGLPSLADLHPERGK